MPKWQHRRIRMTLEFNVDGSLSDGTVIDTAVAEIRKIREVVVTSEDETSTELYVKPPEIVSVSLERR